MNGMTRMQGHSIELSRQGYSPASKAWRKETESNLAGLSIPDELLLHILEELDIWMRGHKEHHNLSGEQYQ